MVAGARLGGHGGNQRGKIIMAGLVRAQRGESRLRVPSKIAAIAEHLIGQPEALRKQVFHRAHFHGVRPGLQHCDDPCGWADLAAQAVECGSNSGGMVGKIIIDLHATRFAAHFHAALDVSEFGQSRQPVGDRHSDVARGQQRRASVGAIVRTGEFP